MKLATRMLRGYITLDRIVDVIMCAILFVPCAIAAVIIYILI